MTTDLIQILNAQNEINRLNDFLNQNLPQATRQFSEHFYFALNEEITPFDDETSNRLSFNFFIPFTDEAKIYHQMKEINFIFVITEPNLDPYLINPKIHNYDHAISHKMAFCLLYEKEIKDNKVDIQNWFVKPEDNNTTDQKADHITLKKFNNKQWTNNIVSEKINTKEMYLLEFMKTMNEKYILPCLSSYFSKFTSFEDSITCQKSLDQFKKLFNELLIEIETSPTDYIATHNLKKYVNDLEHMMPEKNKFSLGKKI